MSQEQIKKLIDERQTLVKNSRDFLEQHEAEGLTADQEAQFERMHKDQEALSAQIAELQAAADRRADMLAQQDAAEAALRANLTTYGDRIAAAGGLASGPSTHQPIDPQRAQDLALQGWMRASAGLEITDEHRKAASQVHCDLHNKDFTINLNARAPKWRDIQAAQGTGSAGAGGVLVPEGFVPELESALLQFSGVRQAATVIRTSSGNDLPWPTDNDTGNRGVVLAESTQDSEQDITFSSLTLQAYKVTSKIIRVSVELIQDSAMPIGQVLGAALGTRLGRAMNYYGTVGTGSSQPNGVVTASTLGVTAAAAAAVTFDEIYELAHSVDPAYRANASWMLNDSTLLAIKKLKDSDNRYLWQSSTADGAPDTIDGKPVIVNNDMAEMATGEKTILFGDMSKYIIREVQGISLVRLVERYADYHEEAYIAIQRWDGDLLDAGTNPVKHLIQA